MMSTRSVGPARVRLLAATRRSSSAPRPTVGATIPPIASSRDGSGRTPTTNARLHGLGLALERDRPGRFELDRPFDRQRRGRADEDPPGRRRRLEPGGHVHRVAGDPSLVGPLALGRDRRRDDRLSGVYPDPDPEGVDVEREPGAQAVDPVDEREAGPDRALGVVIARRAQAERGHHRITDELLERAAVPPDRVADDREVGVLDRRHVLGVETLGERREIDQVSEQHGHDPALDGHPTSLSWPTVSDRRRCLVGSATSVEGASAAGRSIG